MRGAGVFCAYFFGAPLLHVIRCKLRKKIKYGRLNAKNIRERLISSLAILAIFRWNKFTIFFPRGVFFLTWFFHLQCDRSVLLLWLSCFVKQIIFTRRFRQLVRTICLSSTDVAFDSFLIHENMQTSTRQYILKDAFVCCLPKGFLLHFDQAGCIFNTHTYFAHVYRPLLFASQFNFNRNASRRCCFFHSLCKPWTDVLSLEIKITLPL